VNKNIQGVNTFIQRILSVGLLATNAQITGKKVRIVLNSKFVYAVAAAFERLQNGGIVYTTDMNVVFNAVNGGFAQWANSQNSMLVNQLGMNRHAVTADGITAQFQWVLRKKRITRCIRGFL